MKFMKYKGEIVLEAWKFFPIDYCQAIGLAKSLHRKYITFNGRIYNVDDTEMKNPLGTSEELKWEE